MWRNISLKLKLNTIFANLRISCDETAKLNKSTSETFSMIGAKKLQKGARKLPGGGGNIFFHAKRGIIDPPAQNPVYAPGEISY